MAQRSPPIFMWLLFATTAILMLLVVYFHRVVDLGKNINNETDLSSTTNFGNIIGSMQYSYEPQQQRKIMQTENNKEDIIIHEQMGHSSSMMNALTRPGAAGLTLPLPLDGRATTTTQATSSGTKEEEVDNNNDSNNSTNNNSKNNNEIVFRGRFWIDENDNGKIDDGEKGVSAQASVSLWQMIPSSSTLPRYKYLKHVILEGSNNKNKKDDDENDGSYYELRLKDKRKIHNRHGRYYLKFQHNNGPAYGEFCEKIQGGDCHVDHMGFSEKIAVEPGQTYEINAGIVLTGVIFHGRVWYDDNADGLINENEKPSVAAVAAANTTTTTGTATGTATATAPAVVGLFRKTPTSNKLRFVKQAMVQSDGTFMLQLKKVRKRNLYSLHFQRRGVEDSEKYKFTLPGGDSSVDEKGNSPFSSLQPRSRYEINAGLVLRDEDRTEFYGRVWVDANLNGLIDAGEVGVGTARVTLYRRTARLSTTKTPKFIFVKSTQMEPDGTFSFFLTSIKKDNLYYLSFHQHNNNEDSRYVPNVGDSHVDTKGNSMLFEIEKGKRYQINAGISLLPPREEGQPSYVCCLSNNTPSSTRSTPTTTECIEMTRFQCIVDYQGSFLENRSCDLAKDMCNNAATDATIALLAKEK